MKKTPAGKLSDRTKGPAAVAPQMEDIRDAVSRLKREHEDFCAVLVSAGAEVMEARGEPGNLDSIYVYDPALIAQSSHHGGVAFTARVRSRSRMCHCSNRGPRSP